MKLIYSLRFKLSSLYLITIIIPTIILAFSMPGYYQHILSKQTEVLTESTLNILTENINMYLDDLDRLTYSPYLRQASLDALLLKSSGNFDKVDYYTQKMALDEINDILYFPLKMSRKDVISAILITNDGTPIFSSMKWNSITLKENYTYSEQKWYKAAVNANGKAAFISPHSQDYLSTPLAKQVFSVARLIKDPVTQNRLAVVMADADTVVLSQILKKVKFNVSSIVTIFDDKNNLIYSTSPLSNDVLKQVLNESPEIYGNNDSYISVSRPIKYAGWNVVVLLSNKEIMSNFRWIYVIGILFAVGELIIAFSLFFFLSRIITKPFKLMTQAMSEVVKGNMQVSLNATGKDEVSLLCRSLDQMIKRLNILIDREYRSELSKRNAEYHALQSQIQPHFLYNTLNGFIGLNRLGRRDELEDGIISLTGMLRYTLEQGDWTTIAKECTLLRRYCDLQKLRFDDRLEFNIQCSDQVLEFKIPKLLLQPLVENSIIHGTEPIKRKVHINIFSSITAIYDKDYLQILIQDDGAGFDPDESLINNSVGLSNVRERLKYAYDSAVMTIESKVNFGTKITINIPLKDVKT